MSLTLTYEEAVDEVLSMLKEVTDQYEYPVFYENTRKDRPDEEIAFIQVVLRHAFGNQATLGGAGQRIFMRYGVLIATLNFPTGSGLSGPYGIAKAISDAFEGVSSQNGIWFRNIRISEKGRDGGYFQTDVIIEFEYSETK
jgi:hypothetical protein